jgi:autotransporter translocation and assembly factor TamB
VPENLTKEKIEESISNAGHGNISVSLEGFKKGFFLSAYTDSLDVSVDGIPALTISRLEGSFNPRYLLKRKFAFSINGKIGTGTVTGLLKYPAEGEIKIDMADLNAIPYLSHLGIKGSGNISGSISVKDNNAQITFQIPDMAIRESVVIIPFINTFYKAQGVFSVTGNDIRIDSLSLDGEKGHARLKGDITGGVKNLNLELMPDMNKLNAVESMLIGKYQVSPGYYVIPIK